MKSFNMGRFIIRRFPILSWIQTYNTRSLLHDVVAGITVGLILMPQSLANAAIAGMEPQYGLYAAFIGGFVYFIFGTNKNITIGPEAVICVMTYQQVIQRNVDYAVLLCFLSGLVQLCMVVFRLDVLMDFISIPVTAGYISACSITIGSSQLKDLFGLKISSSGFLDNVTQFFENISDIRYEDLALGLVCIVSLLCLRGLPNLNINPNGENTASNRINWTQVFKWVANSRNILVIMICSIIAFLFESMGDGSPFTLTGAIKPGIPDFQLPPFESLDKEGNRIVHFSEMLSNLGASVILVPVVSALTNIAIVKGFTLLVLLALGFLTPYLYYIPKSSLAALIITAIIFMVEYEVVKPLWRSNKKDLFTLVATFFGCIFFEVEYGIVVGVVTDIIFLLYSYARPTVDIETKKIEPKLEYLMISPKGGLYFPSVDYVNSKIEEAITPSVDMTVVMNCQYMINTDYTFAKGISYLMDEFLERNHPLYFVTPEESVLSLLRNILGKNFIYFDSIDEVEARLQEDHSIQEEKELNKEETPTYCKQSVPLDAIICTEDGPNLKRRYSSVQR